MMHTRTPAVMLYKAFVATGVEAGIDAPDAAAAAADASGAETGLVLSESAQPPARDPRQYGLSNGAWAAAFRSALESAEEAELLISSAQIALPRLVLLRHGAIQLWPSTSSVVPSLTPVPPAPPEPDEPG